MSQNTEKDAVASDLKALLCQAAKIVREREKPWESFFENYGIDLNKYAVVIHKSHQKELPEPPKKFDIYFSDFSPKDKILIMPRTVKHPLKGDIVPFGEDLSLA